MNFNYSNAGRLVSLMLGSFGYIWYYQTMDSYHDFIKYFSLHAYFFFWLYYFLHVIHAVHPLSQRWLQAQHTIFKLALPFNAMISLGFWTMVHSFMKELQLPQSKIRCNQFTHTVPLIILIIEFVLNQNIRFQSIQKGFISHQVYIIVAMLVNILYTFLDKPVYPFLNYKDIWSYVYFAVFSFFLMAVYYLCSLFRSGKQIKLASE